jgi:hypothetical protein
MMPAMPQPCLRRRTVVRRRHGSRKSSPRNTWTNTRSEYAALTVARKGETHVTPRDCEEALDRITPGVPGSPLMNAEERRTAA